MARQKQDLLSKLADRGEQVVGRITDLPGAKGLVDRTAAMAKRLDDIQKSLRSLDPLERRVTAIERRLNKLEGKGTTARKTTARRTASARSTGAKRTSTAKRSPSSSKTRRKSS